MIKHTNYFFLFSLTVNQQKPIKGADKVVVDLDLGSPFASKLGLSDIEEWDSKTATTASECTIEEPPDVLIQSSMQGDDAAGAKKKANKKSKKKKKK